MAEKLFSGSEQTPSKQLVINGAISIGYLENINFFGLFGQYLWRDWHTKEVYDLTHEEFLSIKPYPESPIPEPGAET